MSEEKLQFQAEVSKLLNIVAKSLYSEKEIFLRELISNASDACDRLRYAALTQPELTADDPDFKVTVEVDAKAKTVTVSDNGIGMNRDDLIENLGTIARSGTGAFLDQLTGDASKDVALIGQFGVGFYSGLMVADKMDVLSRKAGEDQGWRWTTDGGGEFTIAEAEREGRGTTVTLHLRKDAKEYLEAQRLRTIITTYSDHIALPIALKAGDVDEPSVNQASALWTRQKKDITADQYKEFYHHVGHAFDDPWLTVHARVEGKIEYAMLLFVPTSQPFDLFHPDRKHRVKLYVKRVFITDDCEDLVPAYLRFLRGVVDSEDLPLNISREMLQNNPLLTKIRQAVTKRVLTELTKKADKAPEEYATFWEQFGSVLKEGLYEDTDNRDKLFGLARFKSLKSGEGFISLADYVAGMKEGQESIHYISGEDSEALRHSPQVEGYAARGMDVLLLTDPVDDFWIGAVREYEGKAFTSVTQGGADLDKVAREDAEDGKADDDAPSDSDIGTLIAAIKQNLGEAVKDVRTSDRLTDSPVCLVAAEGDMDIHMERLLKRHGQVTTASARVLEINPHHALIKGMARIAKEDGAVDLLADASHLLLDQARIVEGEPVADAVAFTRRLANVMEKGLG